MNDLHLTLTNEERVFLASLLESRMKNALIEEHRTRAPTVREQVLHKEDLIESLLKKLGRSAA